jgi:hypothetical protein
MASDRQSRFTACHAVALQHDGVSLLEHPGHHGPHRPGAITRIDMLRSHYQPRARQEPADRAGRQLLALLKYDARRPPWRARLLARMC